MEPRARNTVEYRAVTLSNGHKVNYAHQGEGKPVILVHGFAASLHDWDDLLPELNQAGYAWYALDLLGHGESEKPAHIHDYSIQNVYADFSAWMDSLELREPVILVGHSLGAGLSLMYAHRNPERARALAIINPFYTLGQLPPILRRLLRRPRVNAALIERTPYRVLRWFVDMTSFNYSIGDGGTHVLPEHVRYQTALDYKRASSGIYNIPRTLPAADLELSRIHQPTLLLWGARDQTLNPSSFDKLAKSLPNLVNAKRFPICGHVPHQCHPDEFNPVLMEFLRAV